jgi:uncharacterized UPF0160 family protein
MFSFFQKDKLLVTHNGTFHADDIFATAALHIVLGGKIKVVRTRDPKIIAKADFVYDVGGEHNPDKNIFDHHQKGGAGARDNGIPYAAFGLVWKKYGEQICGSKIVADQLDKRLVQPIDANDNGINLFTVDGEIAPYIIQDLFFLFRPSWKEVQDFDTAFNEVVKIAIVIITREIKKMSDNLEAENFALDAYNKSTDKQIVVLEGAYPWHEVLGSKPEPLYAVFPKLDTWRVECVRKEKYSFENRKPLPAEWAGLRDEKLVEATGVQDATFCHNGRFMAVSKTKEGALALANKALLA